MLVELGTLIVEHVTQLVPHHDPDHSVVDGGIGVGIEEQPCMMPAGNMIFTSTAFACAFTVARHRRAEACDRAGVVEPRGRERVLERGLRAEGLFGAALRPRPSADAMSYNS